MIQRNSEQFDLRIISLGAGVQSSVVYWLADRGLIGPKPSVAIFADTQAEPPWVYENLWYMNLHGSIPIHISSQGNLAQNLKDGINSTGTKFSPVPFWTKDAKTGKAIPGRRQCTREYKIDVVKNYTRKLLGLRKGQWATRFRVEQWIGISTDEVTRAKPSRNKWIINHWPLLTDRPMNREDCKTWLKANDLPVPGKSSCYFCPYRQPIEYAKWKTSEPEEFEKACQMDDLIRNNGTSQQEQFVSSLLIPLRLLPSVQELENKPNPELLDNECEGMCGV